MDGYRKVRTKFCAPDAIEIKSYRSLKLAIDDCAKNDNCVGIHDDNCDGNGEFKLCEEIYKISNGVLPASCIYTSDKGNIIKKYSLKYVPFCLKPYYNDTIAI